MNNLTVSSPGKLMLYGEHAVVYGHPCIVTAVDQRMFLTAQTNDSCKFTVDAPDVDISDYAKSVSDIGVGDIPKGVQFVEVALKNVIASRKIDINGIAISTNSEFKSTFGFGSSSASTVCVVKAISELYSLNLSRKELFEISFKTVLDIQGKGSGFDVAAAVYGGTLYFVTGGKVIEPLGLESLPLVVGYSGIKADTVTLINKVADKFSNDKERLDEIYNEISSIVESAKMALKSQNWEELGNLMNQNQALLVELGVSIDKLDAMISGAVNVGAFGGKLSGAGGGDCMISLASHSSLAAVEGAIEKAGGQILRIKTNALGVRIEK